MTRCIQCKHYRTARNPFDERFCSVICHAEYIETQLPVIGRNDWDYKVIMSGGKRRAQHIVIMEALIGRKVAQGEHVHHINMNKDDNRLSNLALMDRREHARIHAYGYFFIDPDTHVAKFIHGSYKARWNDN